MNKGALQHISYLDEPEDAPHIGSLTSAQVDEARKILLFLSACFQNLEAGHPHWERVRGERQWECYYLREAEGELQWEHYLYRAKLEESVRALTSSVSLRPPSVEYIPYRRESGTTLVSFQSDNPGLRQNEELSARIRFLESQLKTDRPYSQLYKFGAGSLFVALISLAFWAVTGIGAPFHPIFALGVVPAALGVMAMAFLVRREKRKDKLSERDEKGA
jgi:hypothetical protein